MAYNVPNLDRFVRMGHKTSGMTLITWILLAFHLEFSIGIEVVMETRDAGFFLKSTTDNVDTQASSRNDKFTIFYPFKPVTVRAHFGPFSVRQSVEPSINAANIAAVNRSDDEQSDFFKEVMNDPDFYNLQENIEVNAHLVTNEVLQDNPVIRVLFHVGHGGVDAKPRKRIGDERHTLCANVYVHNQDTWLVGSCNPNANQDGVCVVEVLLPASWWPLLEDLPTKSAKLHKNNVRVEYSILWAEATKCIPSSLHISGAPTPTAVYLGDALLSSSHFRYEDIKNDGFVRILVPQRTVYPKAKVYVPVYIKNNNSNTNVILMR